MAAPSSRQRWTRSLNDGRRSRLRICFGGTPCSTRLGVVFCNSNFGGEFICGTCGTVMGGGGGGGGGGAVGNGITGDVPGAGGICAITASAFARKKQIAIKTRNLRMTFRLVSRGTGASESRARDQSSGAFSIGSKRSASNPNKFQDCSMCGGKGAVTSIKPPRGCGMTMRRASRCRRF